MKTSETLTKIYKALIKFQGLVDSISKDSVNPFFNSKYANLGQIQKAIKKPLIDSGLGIVQFPADRGGLTTRLFHDSGEWMEETYFMDAQKATPQGWGSVITYQRRYALGAILTLDIDKDDDGQAAENKATQPAAKAQPKPKVKPILEPNTELWEKALSYYIKKPKEIINICKHYIISADDLTKLNNNVEADEIHKDAK